MAITAWRIDDAADRRLTGHEHRIERARSLAIGQHDKRVQLHRVERLTGRDREAREPHDGVGQGLDVRRRRAAEAVEQRRGLQFANHLARLLMVHRREAEYHVAQQFDIHATRAEHHHDAQRRVPARAENAFDAVAHHRRDQHAVDLRSGRRSTHRGHDAVISGAGLVAIADIQDHATDIALMRDGGREHLHCHRKAERMCTANGVGARLRARDRHHGHAEFPQQLQRIGFVVGTGPQRHGGFRRLWRRRRPLKLRMEEAHGRQDADGAGRIGKA